MHRADTHELCEIVKSPLLYLYRLTDRSAIPRYVEAFDIILNGSSITEHDVRKRHSACIRYLIETLGIDKLRGRAIDYLQSGESVADTPLIMVRTALYDSDRRCIADIPPYKVDITYEKRGNELVLRVIVIHIERWEYEDGWSCPTHTASDSPTVDRVLEVNYAGNTITYSVTQTTSTVLHPLITEMYPMLNWFNAVCHEFYTQRRDNQPYSLRALRYKSIATDNNALDITYEQFKTCNVPEHIPIIVKPTRDEKMRLEDEPDVANHVIVDLSNYAGNNYVKISSRYVTDVSMLGGVQNLVLTGCTGITDVSALGSVLWLKLKDCTGITDVSALGRLPELDLTGCTGIMDVSALGGVHILYLNGCINITDVYALGGVRYLSLNGCTGITDVSALGGVQTLYLVDCTGITDVSALKDVKKLIQQRSETDE